MDSMENPDGTITFVWKDSSGNVIDLEAAVEGGVVYPISVVDVDGKTYPINAPQTPQFELSASQITGSGENRKCHAYVERTLTAVTPGVLHESMIAILIADLMDRQKTNERVDLSNVITKLKEALMWLNAI